MSTEQHIRSLLSAADPARDTAVAPPRLSAPDLIVRAEATTQPTVRLGRPRPTRRLVLVAGAVAVAAGAAAAVHSFGESTVDRPKNTSPPGIRAGVVLVPVAYQFESGASGARAQLLALAGRLVDAPYDSHTGRYAYHHLRIWGDPIMTSADGRYVLGFASEDKIWQAADGTGRQTRLQLEPQFPDQESRDYYQRTMTATGTGTPAPDTIPLPPLDIPPLPADRAGLSELLKVRYGAGAVTKEVVTGYDRYVVPRRTRAEILRVLADVPGFLWRGQVTDRAGRIGLAITFDDPEHGQQSLLVFDPATGQLLAHELLTLQGDAAPKRISTYQLILATDRTDQVG
jgi:hypothetical protein